MDKNRTDPPYFPLSEKTESPPLNFLAVSNPPRNEVDHQNYRHEGGHGY